MRDEWKFMQVFGTDTLRKEYRLQEIGVDGRVILKLIVNRWRGGRAGTGLMWLRVGTSCSLL